jgi:hypothetical protein
MSAAPLRALARAAVERSSARSPIDRRAECALTLGCVLGSSDEQLQTVIERRRIAAAGNAPTREAASSIASGSPSSALQTSATASAFADVTAQSPDGCFQGTISIKQRSDNSDE